MKCEVKKIDDVRREIKFEVPKDRVSSKLDEVYRDIGKVAKVKGFRPGKVPRKVLETHHGRVAQEELIKNLIPEVYQEGIIKENLIPVDMPEIHDVNLKDGILKFTAKFDIRPEVKISDKDYKGIKVTRKNSDVTDEEITKTLDYFKQAQGKEKDETKIDDEFARGLGYPSLDDFKKSLKRQLEMDKDRQNRYDIETQVVDALLKKAKLSVPQSLVQKHLEKRLEQSREHFRQHKLSEEEIAKKEEELRKDLKPNIEREVKAYFVLAKIGELENIQAGEGENLPAKVMEYLLKEAKWEEKK